jgi:hypothetical protein
MVIIHMIVLTIAYALLIHTSYNLTASRSLEIYNNLTLISIFYIHSLLLLPILIEKKNLKKYLLLTLGCLVFISIIRSWLRAMHSSLITYHEDGTRPLPMDFFSRKEWIIGSIIEFFPMFITIGGLSFIFYLLIHRVRIFLPYLEIGINLLILAIIYVFAVLAPHMGTKENLSVALLLSVFYTHTFLIAPILIKEKKKLKYGLLLTVLCACYYVLITKVFGIPKFDSETGNPASFKNILSLIFIISSSLLITLFLSFVYAYSRLKIKAREKLFDLKLGAKESELNLLKSQVNPHFLFNSLNTLYATALTEDAPKTAESIAKLASLIRYMQEDINKDFIPLQNEIKYFKDYIAIQKLRCAIEPDVELYFENSENHFISPGLLIPFVENAFKYGINPSLFSKLKISVVCHDNKITFECINSYDENYKTYYKEQGFGIGIENAKQRLELVYPKKHTFEIIKENGNFSIKIVINTSKK